MEIRWRASIRPDGPPGFLPAELHGFGSTPEEALANLRENVEGKLEEAATMLACVKIESETV